MSTREKVDTAVNGLIQANTLEARSEAARHAIGDYYHHAGYSQMTDDERKVIADAKEAVYQATRVIHDFKSRMQGQYIDVFREMDLYD